MTIEILSTKDAGNNIRKIFSLKNDSKKSLSDERLQLIFPENDCIPELATMWFVVFLRNLSLNLVSTWIVFSWVFWGYTTWYLENIFKKLCVTCNWLCAPGLKKYSCLSLSSGWENEWVWATMLGFWQSLRNNILYFNYIALCLTLYILHIHVPHLKRSTTISRIVYP